MPSTTYEVIEFLGTLANEEQLRICATQSLKGAAIAGSSALIGGLLFGPIGIAVAGTLGSVSAYFCTKDKFIPVSRVFQNMNPHQRDAVADRIRRIMESINIEDVALLSSMIAGNETLRRQVVGSLLDHLRNELSLVVVNH